MLGPPRLSAFTACRFHKGLCHTCSQKVLMVFPSGMNHQERQNGSQGPYLPNGAGCSHAASPTSASGRGRCQTPAPARTMEIHLCCRAAAPKAANPFSRQEALIPACPYGTETWKRLSLGLFSRRGSISLPARAQRRLRRQGRYPAAIFRHIPPSLPPAPSEQLGGEVTTPDLPPLSLARTPQILARLMGKAKLWL